MMVLILERVTPSVRGDLSRWLVEVGTGVFVGRVSQIVREALWDRCLQRAGEGSALLVWRTNNEQGWDLRAYQPKGRVPVNVEGVWLTRLVSEQKDSPKP
jgi:CRISPR-associated protein Cas2